MTNAAKWVTTGVLFSLLIVAGCAIPTQSLEPVSSPTLNASNRIGSSLHDGPQLSQPADPASATTSPTRVTPSPEPSVPPNSTPTATRVPSLSPTSTPTPSPTPTPMPSLRQLTQDGCCTQPFWSPDSKQILFIDKPGPGSPTGIWGVDVAESNPTPQLLTERVAFYTPDFTLRTELNQDSTTVERLTSPLTSETTQTQSESSSTPGADSSSTTSWEVPSEGQPVYISPNQIRIVWQVSNYDLPFERRTTQVWVADLDGRAPRMVADVPRGGFNGWISDEAILLSGRDTLESQEQVLFALSLVDGDRLELARGERLRGGLLSEDGAWLAYFVALDKDPEQNGVWLVRSDGSARRKLEPDLFGAYKWRDTHRLVIIPFRPGAASHEIWELDLNTGETHRLTDPDVTPFKIANGDWTVSPDGRQIAFVESRDRNIWLLTLPD